jgi:hypothetical protein
MQIHKGMARVDNENTNYLTGIADDQQVSARNLLDASITVRDVAHRALRTTPP